MLTIATADVPDSAFGFTFTALPMAVPLVRRSLDRFAERLGLDLDSRFSLLTATGEAMANAVEHAYGVAPGLVRVQASLTDDQLLPGFLERDRARRLNRVTHGSDRTVANGVSRHLQSGARRGRDEVPQLGRGGSPHRPA